MNTIEIARIVLSSSLFIFIVYAIFVNYRDKREESLLRTLRMIGDASVIGEAPESAIKRVSEMRHESSSGIFKKILRNISEGNTFTDAITTISKKTSSPILKYMSSILITAKETGTDSYAVINNYTPKLAKLHTYDGYARHIINKNLMVIQIIGVIILPGLFHVLPLFFMGEIIIDSFVFNFFVIFAALIGTMDYLLYEDWISSLIYIPLFASISYLLPGFLDYIFKMF